MCVEFACSPHVVVGFHPGTLDSPHGPKTCGGHYQSAHVSVPCDGLVPQSGLSPALFPEPLRFQTPCDPEQHKW